jgi:hypothetical protein
VKRTLAAAAILAGLLALAPRPAAAQCVMCKTALTGSPEGRGIGQQFNYAILLMVAAPYVVAGGFLLGAYRARLRYEAGRLAARLGARRRLRRTRPFAALLRAGR